MSQSTVARWIAATAVIAVAATGVMSSSAQAAPGSPARATGSAAGQPRAEVLDPQPAGSVSDFGSTVTWAATGDVKPCPASIIAAKPRCDWLVPANGSLTVSITMTTTAKLDHPADWGGFRQFLRTNLPGVQGFDVSKPLAFGDSWTNTYTVTSRVSPGDYTLTFGSEAYGVAASSVVDITVAPVAIPTGATTPESVNYVMTTIGRNVGDGQWKVASANIVSLDKTIYNELNGKRVPVRVASNPVASALKAVTDRGRYILQERAALVTALNKVESLGSAAANAALANIFLEMYKELSVIKPYPVAGDIGSRDTETAQEITAQCRRIKDARKRAAYLKTVIASLTPALTEVKAQRAQLLKLDAQMNNVLRKYGITVGGPAVQPAG